MVQIRLIMLVESRIRGDVYVRFGGEFPKTYHSNMERRWVLSLLQETVKIYEQGKRYYDALKAVNNLVKDARKVQQTVLLVGEISDIYVNSFQKMLTDGNYTPDELSAIASGYAKMLEESSGMLNEMKTVVTSTSLSMTDKERMDVIDRVYRDVRNQRNLVRYYTNRNIGISYLRAKKKNDTRRVLDLYGTDNQKYW